MQMVQRGQVSFEFSGVVLSSNREIFYAGFLKMGLSDFIMQGTTVRVEFGDATTTADPADAHSISRYFPHTYGQPLAHFLRATAKVPDAQIITEHPPFRSTSIHLIVVLVIPLRVDKMSGLFSSIVSCHSYSHKFCLSYSNFMF